MTTNLLDMALCECKQLLGALLLYPRRPIARSLSAVHVQVILTPVVSAEPRA